ncbi:MAG: hypothetical protein ACFB4J_08940 [Elainellaceae cyanobacterium]
MSTASTPAPTGASSSAVICRIVGLTCIAGFISDTITLALPVGPTVDWRVNFLQQVGDRSIIFLFGVALVLYGVWASRELRKSLSYAVLGIGVLFLLCCILVVRDSIVLKSEAMQRIELQATELQTRVEAQEQIDPRVAVRRIDAEAAALKQNARSTLTKAGIRSTGNFVIVGVGLVSLGRLGINSQRSPQSKAPGRPGRKWLRQ